ncbi:hypothetical protein LEP1GSC202_2094 [Leptospira yanagawae serovar Saopaulo str. Sao Paulo = ATCC 700523]|uniref:Uncharacterized protein n=1 Tax=Leptospira yanagawae serovar Saopaulo str. Sao Paulo = ATCC 700523 TaxID=1249483 RepID=A0A5E8HB61_9LEPT|nr:hypothetical protein LEP1GSC202_2094 [Leptospira yanagawae serovar Saopaulo str. Sao Paulo = ATCC 700523]
MINKFLNIKQTVLIICTKYRNQLLILRTSFQKLIPRRDN